jgi:hypothetical protein
MFYAWIQEELSSKVYSINQQDTEILEDLNSFGKLTSETEQSVMACLEVSGVGSGDGDLLGSRFHARNAEGIDDVLPRKQI